MIRQPGIANQGFFSQEKNTQIIAQKSSNTPMEADRFSFHAKLFPRNPSSGFYSLSVCLKTESHFTSTLSSSLASSEHLREWSGGC